MVFEPRSIMIVLSVLNKSGKSWQSDEFGLLIVAKSDQFQEKRYFCVNIQLKVSDSVV